MSVKAYTSIILILIGLNIYAQNKKQTERQLLEEYFNDAQTFFDEDQDYREALFNFLKIYEKDSLNANINYSIGMCYVNIPGEETKAIPYFERALPKISTKYEKGKFSERSAPLYMLYYLGNAYRINNQISKALAVYNKFRNHPYFEGHYNEGMVDSEIEACERAKIIQDNPINAKFTNLGSIINNSQTNRNPVINKDENQIIYLSGLKFYDAIMMSKKVDGLWTEPENISPQVGSDGDCAPVCLSSDGLELYIVKTVKKNNTDIYVSKWTDGKWGLMTPLNKNINTSNREDHASISADGKSLYFCSDRRGGEGGMDIYKSDKQANGDWGPAINMGKNINSEFDETTPFICEDGRTLYYSSKGLLNMGGYDIFTTQLIGNKWGNPANIGYPINTTGDNIFYYPIKNGEIAYSAIVRTNGFGKEDIYRIENLTLQARNNHSDKRLLRIVVKDKKTNDVLGVLFFDQKADTLAIQQTSEMVDIRIDE